MSDKSSSKHSLAKASKKTAKGQGGKEQGLSMRVSTSSRISSGSYDPEDDFSAEQVELAHLRAKQVEKDATMPKDPTAGFHGKIVSLEAIDAQKVFPRLKTDEGSTLPFFGDEFDFLRPKIEVEKAFEALQSKCQEKNRKKLVRVAVVAATCLTGVGGLWALSKIHLVPSNKVMVTINRGKPELYGPGFHTLLSPFNSAWVKFEVSDPELIVQAASLSVITVSANEWGLGSFAGQPRILTPGVHVIDDPVFSFLKRIDQTDREISVQGIHRVIVDEGCRGLAYEGNRPLILKPGIYQRKNPLFRFITTKKLDKQRIDLSPFNIITVRDGEVGVSFQRGTLIVLEPGEHWLNQENNELFVDFLTTREQVRSLATVEVLTNDGLIVRLKASISFRITNPVNAIKVVGDRGEKRADSISERIFETVMARADNTFAGLLTGSDLLSSVALGVQQKNVAATSRKTKQSLADDTDDDDATAVAMARVRHEGVVFDGKEHSRRELNKIISAQFLGRLSSTLRKEWGVQLNDMSVVEIEILDKDVRHALADGIRGNIEAATQRRNAEARAETKRILAAGERDALKINADGQAYEIKAKAQAQHEAGELLQSTPVAVEIRLAEAAAQAVSKSRGLVIVPDVSSRSLMQLIGASSRIHAASSAAAAYFDSASTSESEAAAAPDHTIIDLDKEVENSFRLARQTQKKKGNQKKEKKVKKKE